MKQLPLILIGALLLGCATIAEAPVAEKTVFESVCETMQVNCSGIDAPILVLSQIVEDYPCFGCRYNGFTYAGEPYIFVNPMVSLQQQARTEFHETVHYVVAQAEIDLSRCRNEELARKLTAQYFEYDYDPEWIPRYECNEELLGIPEVDIEELEDWIINIIEIVKGE